RAWWTPGHNASLMHVVDLRVRRLHQKSADDFLDVEFISSDRLGMKPHHATVPLLSQEVEHLRREVRANQNLREKLVNGTGEFEVPRPVRNDDPAEGRIRISCQSFAPCLHRR